jgi:pantothenate kinase-related protein Tda10
LWRQQAETAMRAAGKPGMTDDQVGRYTYIQFTSHTTTSYPRIAHDTLHIHNNKEHAEIIERI